MRVDSALPKGELSVGPAEAKVAMAVWNRTEYTH